TCSTPPLTSCTTMGYDAANELTAITYSDGVTPNVSNIAYDGDGQRTGLSDGTLHATWSYASLHRLTSSGNGAGATVGYDYLTPSGGNDLKDQVGHIIYPNSAGTVTQTWDTVGRLQSVQDWNSRTTTFAYDTNSNLKTETVPSTPVVTDSLGY